MEGGLKMHNKPYVYAIVRRDISQPQQAVQVAHAILEAGKLFDYPAHKTSIIILEVLNKQELIEAHHRLNSRGVANYMFFEPDFDMGESAIATQALIGSQRNIMKKYNLLKEKK